MDKVRLGRKLKELRIAAGFETEVALFHAEGSILHQSGIKLVESGKQGISLDHLENWVTVCGSTLSRFCADLEDSATGPVRIKPGFDRLYQSITWLTEQEPKVAKALQTILETLIPEGALKAGNLQRRQRKKGGDDQAGLRAVR